MSAMKAQERETARSLRLQGYSLNEICEMVGVSKGSASVWVRDIELTGEQIEHLKSKGMLCDAGREKYSATMRRKREARYAVYREKADEEYPLLCQDRNFVFGLALYIGEGGKTSRGVIEIANCDYRVIRKSIDFFQTIGIAKERIRCLIYLHPGLSEREALQYWQDRLDLEPQQFIGIGRAVSRASQGVMPHRQPNGTCRMYACETEIKQKLLRWIELALQ